MVPSLDPLPSLAMAVSYLSTYFLSRGGHWGHAHDGVTWRASAEINRFQPRQRGVAAGISRRQGPPPAAPHASVSGFSTYYAEKLDDMYCGKFILLQLITARYVTSPHLPRSPDSRPGAPGASTDRAPYSLAKMELGFGCICIV